MALIDRRTPLSLADTLGAVLASVVDAQRQAARATVEFIEEVGFAEDASDGDGKDAARELRSVPIRYSKLDENGETASYVLDLPLLSLVNIPMVAVKEATVRFDWEVTESGESPPAKKSTATRTVAPSVANLRIAKSLPQAALLRGRIDRVSPVAASRPSSGGDDKSERRTSMEVSVTLEQSAIPVGMDRLFDILELAASEKQADTPANDDPNNDG